MNRLVLDLLDIQMAEDGALHLDLAPVSLGELLVELEQPARARLAARGQRLAVGEAEGFAVLADSPHLYRVLMNLIDNCAKYGREGGLVGVDVLPSGHDTRVIRVSDDGPGVPERLRERIFDKYAQAEREDRMRSRDSRGLGLRFCKVIVEAHGGRIWVEDAEPRGARFCVELPSA